MTEKAKLEAEIARLTGARYGSLLLLRCANLLAISQALYAIVRRVQPRYHIPTSPLLRSET